MTDRPSAMPAAPADGPADIDSAVDIAVPELLLMPLIEVAADVLRELEAVDVPASLRQLHGFDRRGLLAGPAPRQLRRAIAHDGAFGALVVDQFVARPEVEAVLADWSAERATTTAADAAARGDLPLFTSALWAARPAGYAFGLGIAVVLDVQLRERRREDDAGKTLAQERAALEEARRRTETARLEAEATAAKAEQELQKERTARRTREDEAIAAAGAAQRQADVLQTQLDQANAVAEEQQNVATRASQRARSLEDDLRRLRADTRELRARAESKVSRLGDRDEKALADAATAARQLSVSIDALQRRIRDTEKTAPNADAVSPREPAPTRRAQPKLPKGLVAESSAGIEAMLGTADVVLIVDGYNVAHRAWPEATAADQRERLGIAMTALSRRLGCDVVLVFDGDGSGPLPPLRRGGVRVLFSDAGQEADEVVLRELEDRPRRVPVVVASSDAWVREHAAAQGAVVVSADALTKLLRPDK
jgi:predicted RNA-binding protein with PIN domain